MEIKLEIPERPLFVPYPLNLVIAIPSFSQALNATFAPFRAQIDRINQDGFRKPQALIGWGPEDSR